MTSLRHHLRKIHPASLLLISFLTTIFVGAGFLTLPVSTRSGQIHVVDALFTATSAVCVTGLTVQDTGTYFSMFGQIVILILIQIGGLGLMTISVMFFRFFGKSVSFQHRMAMQETFSHTPRKDIYSILKSIFIFTGLTELVGAVLLTISWSRQYPFPQAAYLGLFHSVSAFCNAGFSLFASSLVDFRDSIPVNLTICGLIVLGGIGFPVIYDLHHYLSQCRHARCKFSIQTKSVLTTTFILIVAGTMFYLMLEQAHSLKGSGLGHQILYSLFQSITARTAGFNTLDLSGISNACAMIMMLLMFIGASPGSCAGGIKTTTLTVLVVSTWNRLKGNYRPSLFKKSISEANITKSLSIVGLSTFLIVLVFSLMLICQPAHQIQGPIAGDQFRVYLFEVISAFGTVGLSLGATSVINDWGKLLLVIMMLIGRVGVMSFSYVITVGQKKSGIEYVEENLMLG
jgi:trk system potassium uptake protein TrkH